MGKAADIFSWAAFGTKLLGFLQAVIPAFLMAWVASLRSQRNRQENLLDYERMKRRTEGKLHELERKNNGRTGLEVIGDFLDRGPFEHDGVRKDSPPDS